MMSGNVLNTVLMLCRTKYCVGNVSTGMLCQADTCRLYAMIGTDDRCSAQSVRIPCMIYKDRL